MIDAVLRFKIIGIGRRPMLIQCSTNLLISHSGMLILLLSIVHLEPSIFHMTLNILAEPILRPGLTRDLAQVVSETIFCIARLVEAARHQRLDPLLGGRSTE